jgi:hypothetical protein
LSKNEPCLGCAINIQTQQIENDMFKIYTLLMMFFWLCTLQAQTSNAGIKISILSPACDTLCNGKLKIQVSGETALPLKLEFLSNPEFAELFEHEPCRMPKP